MRWTGWLALSVTAVAACDREETSNAPEEAATDTQRKNAAPPWLESTYVSKDKETDHTDSDEPEAEAPDEPIDDGKLRDPEKAREMATEAASEMVDRYSPTVMTPALVTAWPSDEPKVMYIIYPLIPSDSGVTTFKVDAPVKVTVSLLDGSTEVEKLAKSTQLKTLEEKRERSMEHDRIVAAERAVIELLLGEREFSKATGYLDGYEEWFLHHDKVTIDLRSRIPAVLQWHRHPHE